MQGIVGATNYLKATVSFIAEESLIASMNHLFHPFSTHNFHSNKPDETNAKEFPLDIEFSGTILQVKPMYLVAAITYKAKNTLVYPNISLVKINQ